MGGGWSSCGTSGSLAAQAVAHPLPGVVQEMIHGTDRDAQAGGDWLAAVASHAEGQDDPLLFRKPTEATLKHNFQLPKRSGFLRAGFLAAPLRLDHRAARG